MATVFMQRVTWRSWILIAAETGLIVAAVSLAAYVRLQDAALTSAHLSRALVIAFICQVCLYYAELYDFRVLSDRRELVVRLLQSLGATSLLLAAVYFFSAMLMMILPIRAAGIVLTHAADALFWAVIALFATIVGCLVARWAFGQSSVLWALVNWRFLFAAAIVGCHFTMNELRRNILLRSLFFVIFAAATLACLFWTFPG